MHPLVLPEASLFAHVGLPPALHTPSPGVQGLRRGEGVSSEHPLQGPSLCANPPHMLAPLPDPLGVTSWRPLLDP